MSYLTVFLQGCYRVLNIYELCRAPEPPYRADANVDSTAATARRCCGIGVRVSAPSRRGAAPYADGSLSSQTPSHLISLTLSAVLGLSSRLTWHDFAYATMAQKVHSSTLVYPLYPYPSFWDALAPTCPSPRTPRYNPGGHLVHFQGWVLRLR